MTVRQKGMVAFAFVAFAWVTTFHAPRPIANTVPAVPKEVATYVVH